MCAADVARWARDAVPGGGRAGRTQTRCQLIALLYYLAVSKHGEAQAAWKASNTLVGVMGGCGRGPGSGRCLPGSSAPRHLPAPCRMSESSLPASTCRPTLHRRCQVEYARPLTEAEEAEVAQGEGCRKLIPHCSLCVTPYGSSTPLCLACEPPYMADGRGGWVRLASGCAVLLWRLQTWPAVVRHTASEPPHPAGDCQLVTDAIKEAAPQGAAKCGGSVYAFYQASQLLCPAGAARHSGHLRRRLPRAPRPPVLLQAMDLGCDFKCPPEKRLGTGDWNLGCNCYDQRCTRRAS